MTEDLFTYADKLPAHQKHSKTSKAAAISIKPRIGPMHARIINFLRICCGATDEEMQKTLSMKESTQRPRRRELQQWGFVEDSGKTRQTKSGRAAVVWVLATASPTHRGCSEMEEGAQ